VPFQLGIADTLRASGLLVVEAAGWQKRGGESFNPVGVMCHHTASKGPAEVPSLKTCIDGRPDLAGPLCHVLIARSGICHVIAAGKANHAGGGSYGGYSGNTHWFGIEAENDGVGEPWPHAQVASFVTAARALAALSSKGLVCGHKEYAPKRKIDPTLDMDWFRAQVAQPQEADMPLTPDERTVLDNIAHAVVPVYEIADARYQVRTIITEQLNALVVPYLASLTALVGKAGAVNPADVETLAAKVADELAARLKG
jgi:hypothetical protein